MAGRRSGSASGGRTGEWAGLDPSACSGGFLFRHEIVGYKGQGLGRERKSFFFNSSMSHNAGSSLASSVSYISHYAALAGCKLELELRGLSVSVPLRVNSESANVQARVTVTRTYVPGRSSHTDKLRVLAPGHGPGDPAGE